MDSSQTVVKALDVVEFVANARSALSIRTIADGVDISSGSAYRVINALEQRGAIRRLPDGRVVLGDFLVQVASAVDYYPRLRLAAAGPLMDLRAACGMETVGLYVRLNSAEMTCIESLPGNHGVLHVERLYQPVPIARGAVSLALLAIDVARFGKEAVRVYLHNLPADARPEDVDAVISQIIHLPADGVVPSMGNRVPDAASIACPIPAQRGYSTAVVAVSGTARRFSAQPTREWGERLKRAAAKIADSLAAADLP